MAANLSAFLVLCLFMTLTPGLDTAVDRRPTSPSPVLVHPLSIIKQHIDGQARPL